MSGVSNVSAIAAGFSFSLALSEGKVYSFGRNQDGELGTGGTEASNAEPVEVKGIGPVAAIDAGNVFGIALLQSGEAGPAPLVTSTVGERSMSVAWGFSEPEFGARWLRYQECPEVETEEEIESEEKCTSRESNNSGAFVTITAEHESLSYEEQSFTFTNLSKIQPYEVTLRSFTGLGKTGEERKRYIWATPLPARPTVTGVSPGTGRTAGGTSVTITGTNFTEASPVVGSAPPTQRASSSTLGQLDHGRFARRGGGHPGHHRDDGRGYECDEHRPTITSHAVAPPTVTGASPSSGPVAGGTSVTIARYEPQRSERGEVRRHKRDQHSSSPPKARLPR